MARSEMRTVLIRSGLIRAMAKGTKPLLSAIAALRRGDAGKLVSERMAEFRMRRKSSADVFSELCFCILTANYTAEGGIRIQKELGTEFHALSEKKLASRLRTLGHRFPNARARYIAEARSHEGSIRKLLHTCDAKAMREWLKHNVTGLGYKEASHFLRNIGETDLAIIDFHIVDVLARNGLIRRPKPGSLSNKKTYFATERVLATLAAKAGLTLAELDLYLWYMETGKILK